MHRYGLLEVPTLWKPEHQSLHGGWWAWAQRPILVFPKGHDVLAISRFVCLQFPHEPLTRAQVLLHTHCRVHEAPVSMYTASHTCSQSSQLSTLLPGPASSPPTPSACLGPPFTLKQSSASIYYAHFCAILITDSTRGLGEQGEGDTDTPQGLGGQGFLGLQLPHAA